MFFMYLGVWIIFNGRLTVEIVLIGLVIAALMCVFTCKFMDYSLEKEKLFYKRIFFFGTYIALLIKEIIKANLLVMRMILNGNEIVEPVIVRIKTNLKTETARVILANSITLTPGTITVSLKDDELIVHCLDKSMAEGMEQSLFVKMLEELEEREES